MNWLDRLYNTNPVVHYVVLGFAFVWHLLWRVTHPWRRP